MLFMQCFSRSSRTLVIAALAAIGLSAVQPALAATGHWRFIGYGVTPPQSQLDETDRATRATGHASETRVGGAFQPASSGAGALDLFFKNEDVDRRAYLTTLKFSFTTGVEMRVLTPGQKLHFNGVLVMGGNSMSKAMPARGTGTIAVGNGDYFITTNGAIDQPASGVGDFVVSPGGDTLAIHVEAHLSSYGGLTGRIDINYQWTPGPPPQLGAAGAEATTGQTSGTENTAGRPPAVDVLGDALQVSELDGRWTGTWVRRPGTNIFDAQWHGASDVTDVVRLQSLRGGQVVFSRDGNGGTYTGTFDVDGQDIRGTASWYQPGWTWTARIQREE